MLITLSLIIRAIPKKSKEARLYIQALVAVYRAPNEFILLTR